MHNSVCHCGKGEISMLLDYILDHVNTGKYNEHRLSAYIYDILTRLTVQPARESSCIEEAVQYLTKHFRETPSVEDTAAYVSLNPQYFSRLFKQQTGTSPHNFHASFCLIHVIMYGIRIPDGQLHFTVLRVFKGCGNMLSPGILIQIL